MSKARKIAKVVTIATAVAGTVRYLSDETNRSTLYYRVMGVGKKIANEATAAKARFTAPRVG